MSAHTLVTTYYTGSLAPNADGLTVACGTFTGSASYDAGGSVLDLSSIFKSKVHWAMASTNNADYSAKWVPAAADAAATGKFFIDNDAGTESSGDLHTITFQWFAIGTDA